MLVCLPNFPSTIEKEGNEWVELREIDHSSWGCNTEEEVGAKEGETERRLGLEKVNRGFR